MVFTETKDGQTQVSATLQVHIFAHLDSHMLFYS